MFADACASVLRCRTVFRSELCRHDGGIRRQGTIYRRWPSKDELVLAAVVEGLCPAAAPRSSGSLRADLLRIGNTTSRVDFGCDPGEWTDAWSATGISHHWALATGNLLPELRATAELLGIELAEVAVPARNEDL